MDAPRRALRPYERVIAFLGCLLLVGVVLQIGYVASGEDSVFGFGAPEVCVTASSSQLDRYQVARLREHGVGNGVRIHASDFDVCRDNPTTQDRFLSSIEEGSNWLFGVGVLLLLWRLLRRARREGVFVDAFARRVSTLGLFVLLGAAAVNVAQTWSQWKLLNSLLPVESHSAPWHISFTPLLLGLGLITVGRLMATTVPMREELDATV